MSISSGRPADRHHRGQTRRLRDWAAIITAVALLISAISSLLIALLRT